MAFPATHYLGALKMVGDPKIAKPLSKQFDRSRVSKTRSIAPTEEPAKSVEGERARMVPILVTKLDNRAYDIINPIVASLKNPLTNPLVLPKKKGSGYTDCIKLITECLTNLDESVAYTKANVFRAAKRALILGYKKDSKLLASFEYGFTLDKLYILCFPNSEY